LKTHAPRLSKNYSKRFDFDFCSCSHSKSKNYLKKIERGDEIRKN